MKVAFFVSSAGDTDLAKATIATLVQQQTVNAIFIVPLTTTAIDRTKDLKDNPMISIISIEEITKQPGILAKDKISAEEAETVRLFIEDNAIQHAYLGVPSSNNEVPYQIASQLTIPFTIAY
jgi:hypothetical protein